MDFSEKIKKKTVILLLIVLIFYITILIVSDIEKISASFFNIKFEYYLIIFPLVIIRLFVLAFRFHILLTRTKLGSSIKENFGIYIAGLSMVLTPGGAGALVKSYILKQKLGKSYSSSAPVIIFEKWLDLSSIVIMIGFLLIWANFVESFIVFGIGILFSIVVFIILTKFRGFNRLNNLIQKISFLRNKTINIEEYQKTTKTLTTPKFTFNLLLLSIIPKLITVVIVYLIFKSFGSDLDIFSSSQILFTSTLIGVLSFVPAGIIVTETSLIGMLLLHDVQFDTATLLTVILRFVNIWFLSILGIIFLKLILKNSS